MIKTLSKILYPSLASMQLGPLVIHLVVSPLSVHSHSNPSACQKQQLIFQQLDSKTIMNKPGKKANIKGQGRKCKEVRAQKFGVFVCDGCAMMHPENAKNHSKHVATVLGKWSLRRILGFPHSIYV